VGEISGSWLSETRSANGGFVVDVATGLWLGAPGLYSVYDARAMVDVLTLEAIACHIILDRRIAVVCLAVTSTRLLTIQPRVGLGAL